MSHDSDGRVAVYIDFDNIVISRYNQLHGPASFASDRVREAAGRGSTGDPQVLERIRKATVDIGAILDYASSFGEVVSSCAYADWSQPINAAYRRQLVDRAVVLTQMFPLTATKNGADIRLAIDVVEDLFRLRDVTHVVLVAGDSDYVALAQRVKRLGRFIVAVGVAGATSKSLPAACNEFSLYDDLPGVEVASSPSGGVESTSPTEPPSPGNGSEHERKTASKASAAAKGRPAGEAQAGKDAAEVPGDATESAGTMSSSAATKLLLRALELGHDKAGREEWLPASGIKTQIKRINPAFHEKSLGYSSFGAFLDSRQNLVEVEKGSKGHRVRLRPSSPTD